MPTGVATCLVIPALPEFTARHPQIQLDIGCSERVVDLVQEGIDCAFRGGVVTDQDLVCRPVGQMRFCLCASPGYLLGSTPIQRPDDLLQHRYLGFTFPASGKQLTAVLQRGDDSFTIEQLPAMRFNNGSAYITAGLAGLGIVSVPRAEASPYFATGALVEVLPGWELRSMPISLVYPYTRHLSARVRAFAEWGMELMASHPLWTTKR